MEFVIINSDDFGLSDGICKSILELFESNAISNTSLMVAAPNANKIISKFNGKNLLGIAGVHLQLTAGKPLTSRNIIPSVYDSNSSNIFKDPRKGVLPQPKEVEIEWRSQIELACKLLGGLPTHIDSHHGVHRIPEFSQIYIKLAKEYGIPMRGAVSGPFREIIKKYSLPATIAIVREWTGRMLGPNDLIKQIENIKKVNPNENIVEIISHPGYSDKYLESISSFSSVRENDHAVLLELAKKDWWNKNGFKLISYKDFGCGLD